jgi:hypothetical protein
MSSPLQTKEYQIAKQLFKENEKDYGSLNEIEIKLDNDNSHKYLRMTVFELLEEKRQISHEFELQVSLLDLRDLETAVRICVPFLQIIKYEGYFKKDILIEGLKIISDEIKLCISFQERKVKLNPKELKTLKAYERSLEDKNIKAKEEEKIQKAQMEAKAAQKKKDDAKAKAKEEREVEEEQKKVEKTKNKKKLAKNETEKKKEVMLLKQAAEKFRDEQHQIVLKKEKSEQEAKDIIRNEKRKKFLESPYGRCLTNLKDLEKLREEEEKEYNYNRSIKDCADRKILKAKRRVENFLKYDPVKSVDIGFRSFLLDLREEITDINEKISNLLRNQLTPSSVDSLSSYFMLSDPEIMSILSITKKLDCQQEETLLRSFILLFELIIDIYDKVNELIVSVNYDADIFISIISNIIEIYLKCKFLHSVELIDFTYLIGVYKNLLDVNKVDKIMERLNYLTEMKLDDLDKIRTKIALCKEDLAFKKLLRRNGTTEETATIIVIKIPKSIEVIHTEFFVMDPFKYEPNDYLRYNKKTIKICRDCDYYSHLKGVVEKAPRSSDFFNGVLNWWFIDDNIFYKKISLSREASFPCSKRLGDLYNKDEKFKMSVDLLISENNEVRQFNLFNLFGMPREQVVAYPQFIFLIYVSLLKICIKSEPKDALHYFKQLKEHHIKDFKTNALKFYSNTIDQLMRHRFQHFKRFRFELNFIFLLVNLRLYVYHSTPVYFLLLSIIRSGFIHNAYHEFKKSGYDYTSLRNYLKTLKIEREINSFDISTRVETIKANEVKIESDSAYYLIKKRVTYLSISAGYSGTIDLGKYTEHPIFSYRIDRVAVIPTFVNKEMKDTEDRFGIIEYNLAYSLIGERKKKINLLKSDGYSGIIDLGKYREYPIFSYKIDRAAVIATFVNKEIKDVEVRFGTVKIISEPKFISISKRRIDIELIYKEIVRFPVSRYGKFAQGWRRKNDFNLKNKFRFRGLKILSKYKRIIYIVCMYVNFKVFDPNLKGLADYG